jgi:hypothetical protein
VSHRDVHSNVGIDWSDPEQAALQAKIDTLRGMISHNPMSYSEKDEMVRAQLKDQARREDLKKAAQKDPKKWDI